MTLGAMLQNGGSAALDAVPRLSLPELRSWVVRRVGDRECRLCALFDLEVDGHLELIVVLAEDLHHRLWVARAPLDPSGYPALTPECPAAHLFERELFERSGVEPKGHPWLKPVRSTRPGATAGASDFYRVEGESVHEVAVGPVHAGVIEPGHFRFQCHGEVVFHLEIALGYQHRGIERAILREAPKRVLHSMETAAGDTTVGHALAYCQLVEGMGPTEVPVRADALRAIALELERLANHTGDLGALSGDVGFLPTAAYCGRLRGDFLNMTAILCGSRFGRGLLRPGGVGFDVTEAQRDALLGRLDQAQRDVEGAADALFRAPTVQSRFEETGVVAEATARGLGLVGVAARASGLDLDVRRDHPLGTYKKAEIAASTARTGDVLARAQVRWQEIERSAGFIRDQLTSLAAGPIRAPSPPLPPERLGVALVEGWRGEICHVGLSGQDGRWRRYKIVDPSFHNWSGLAMALRNQQISDFPLCNKSFNLSYAGHDL